MSASNFTENSLLDHLLGQGSRSFTQPELHVALFTGPASDVSAALESGDKSTSAGNWGRFEVNTGGYTRKEVTFNAASNGQAVNSAQIEFPSATANYNNTAGSGSTVTYVAIMSGSNNDDGSTTTQCLVYGALTNTKEILQNDQLVIAAGSLTVSLA